MDSPMNVLVAVGSISLSTEDGDVHLLVAGGESVELSTPELDCLASALNSYFEALE